MGDSISGIIAGVSAQPPQQVVPTKPASQQSAPQSKGDTVSISAQAKQAVQTYSPTEEMKESVTRKGIESSQGKK